MLTVITTHHTRRVIAVVLLIIVAIILVNELNLTKQLIYLIMQNEMIININSKARVISHNSFITSGFNNPKCDNDKHLKSK